MDHGTMAGSWSMMDSQPLGSAGTLGLGRSLEFSPMAPLIGGRWFSDGEMVPGARRRDWSRGGCGA
jgi:hypothetical protein